MEKISAGLSVVLPVYNEKELLEPAVDRNLQVLEAHFDDYEVIVVDDGSGDGIEEVLERLARRPHVTVIRNLVNLNQGIGIQRGLVTARCEFVVHNAVDLPLAPEDLPDLMTRAVNCDLLVQQRSSYAGYEKWRVVTSLLNRGLVKLFYGGALKGIYDMNFTQIYRRSMIPSILPLAKSPTFTTVEMIVRARMLGFSVQTVLIDYKPRLTGKGAFGKPHDILWTLYELTRFRVKLWRNRKRTLRIR